MRSQFLAVIKSKILDLLLENRERVHTIWMGPWRHLRLLLNIRHKFHIKFGLYEKEVSPFLTSYAPSCATCLDVGADEGWHSVYFLNKTAAKTVHAFDPRENTFNRVKSNILLNNETNLDRFKFHQCAVGAGENPSNLNSTLRGVEYPLFVKVDVDGGEVDVLKSAENVLRGGQCFLLLETHSQQLESECMSLLAAFEHQPLPVRANRLLFKEGRPIPFNHFILSQNA